MMVTGEILFCRRRSIRLRFQGRELWLPKEWNGKVLRIKRPAGITEPYDPGPAVISVPRRLAEKKDLTADGRG